ncbi:glycosyl transferase group 1 [Thermotomaculum hydrothermale]|uniref:Glycosyl transferase group 1 n=1 Tax=Thermotomaculum hydrothermale TaxID=981385 RepID=A0A7R6T059_9BACT|nr:DUF1972 domain-containing protein [Thermotomaculum hydrothermale]BBB33392.1 glycosyl transferase group 1 [Thermotomaculum hydrothermale]
MKIAILGTRGIPNAYGGFEQCAEKLSICWVKKGHKVVVYNTDEHPYKKSEFNDVEIRHIFAKESKLKIFGTFIYDYLCLKNAVKDDFDIILNLGYVPSALFFYLKKKTGAKFLTNMDGLEWKREKWSSLLKKFIKLCERRAVAFSDFLIFDNEGIRDYYLENFKVDGEVIPYGAGIFDNPDLSVLEKYGVKKYSYFLTIARFEPENNLETIIKGYLKSNSKFPLLLVGNPQTKHGKYLVRKYGDNSNIRFLGAIYNQKELNTLRLFSKLYFHGHSVGGTNPSLLEAMAAGAYIVAHRNRFNRSVLKENGLFFETDNEIAGLINSFDEGKRIVFQEKNVIKIKNYYNWESVAEKYLRVFEKVLNSN